MTASGEIMNGTYARHPGRRNTQFKGPQRVAFKALADVSDETDDAETRLIFRQDIKRVLGLLDTIPARENLAIRMKFGIGCEPHTLDQIAELYGTARERPRQIIVKGLDRLRFKLRIVAQKDDPVAYEKLIKQRAADAKARAALEAERKRQWDLEIAESKVRREQEEKAHREQQAQNWRTRKRELELGTPSMEELRAYRPRAYVIFRNGQWITVHWHHH